MRHVQRILKKNMFVTPAEWSCLRYLMWVLFTVSWLAYSRSWSPAHDFILVAGDFKPLPSFFNPYHRHICESDLICWRKNRHGYDRSDRLLCLAAATTTTVSESASQQVPLGNTDVRQFRFRVFFKKTYSLNYRSHKKTSNTNLLVFKKKISSMPSLKMKEH